MLAQSPAAVQFSEDQLSGFTYRALGPYRAGSWIADIAVPDAPQKSHLYTFYVAVRYGGLWKTTNNGTTFEPVFDRHDVTGIGCVTIAPSNENIVWIGTGDASSVRVAYPGDGVYKSVDAGKTWQQMGLRDTQHIARIVVHPKNPDIVYVAAMGHLWSTNEERGVFKTSDGGKTWKKVLYLNDKTGAIDLVVNRREPDTLYAAMYEVQRRPWKLLETGVASGIHKTTDGGKTWTKLTGGFPTTPQGRIGLDIYQKNPNILYAVTENFGKRPPTEDEAKRDKARNIEPQPRNIGGEVYRTDDGGKTWKKMNAATDDVSSKAGYSFNQIRVDQNNDKKIIINCDSLLSSEDGGKTWTGLTWNSRNLFDKAFGDYRTMWIDPQNSDRWILGSDGGVHVSYDAGKTCDHYANIPGGEFYSITVDMENPYRIYGGMQDHDSWRGPINGPAGRVGPEDWVTVGDNDGMYNRVDPTDSRWVYNTIQWGGHYRYDQKTRTRKAIVPTRAAGPAAAPLELDAAAGALALQQPHRLHRRAGALPLARPGRPLGGDQPRPHRQRRVEDLAAGHHRAVLHDYHHLRVARHPRRDLGRDRRRQGAGDEEPRRDVDRCDGEGDGGRRARLLRGDARAGIADGGGHRVHHQERAPVRRVQAVHPEDDRLRGDVDGRLRQPGRPGD